MKPHRVLAVASVLMCALASYVFVTELPKGHYPAAAYGLCTFLLVLAVYLRMESD